MKQITFSMHIDPSLYNFLLRGCHEALVTYSVLELEGEVYFNKVELVATDPRVMMLLNDNMQVVDQALNAAQNNFNSTFVNP